MIVVDTNVVVYLVTGARAGSSAQRLLQLDSEWVAPGILASELRNVLLGLVRSNRVIASDALAMYDDALAVLQDRWVEADGAQVIATALESSLSAYDAEFIVLARDLGCTLVSADGRILEAAPDVAVSLATY